MFRSLFLLLFITIVPFLPKSGIDAGSGEASRTAVSRETTDSIGTTRTLYEDLRLERTVSYEAFEEGLRGYMSIDNKEKEILTLIDFSKPSNLVRLAVIDLRHGKVLHTSVVSHGKGSGSLYATKFSNRDGSHKSSLGFYLTGNAYKGSNGYSLKLIGLEKGYNDNAFERAIVIHGADYCSESVVKSGGQLGRSWGCPALPRKKNRKIIDTIKGGSVLFIYAEDRNYLAHSPILSSAEAALAI